VELRFHSFVSLSPAPIEGDRPLNSPVEEQNAPWVLVVFFGTKKINLFQWS